MAEEAGRDVHDALCRSFRKVSRLDQFDYLILLMECRILPPWFAAAEPGRE